MTKDNTPISLEVEALCNELIEGAIDEQKVSRLEQLVRKNPNAKRTYIEFFNLHAALYHCNAANLMDVVSLPESQEEEASEAVTPIPTKALFVPSPILPWSVLVGILVVTFLGGAWALRNWQNDSGVGPANDLATNVQGLEDLRTIDQDETDKEKTGTSESKIEYIAELVWPNSLDRKNANMQAASSKLAKGETLRIQNEDVQVRFACGAVVTLHGPAVFRIVSEKVARLEYGSLEAKVPPQAIGFLIDTPATRVIDLGTEFAVTVAANGNTNINVLNGEVEAEPMRPWLTGHELRHKLFEGDSLRLSPPVTKSFRVDFDTPDALDVFDIVRHDPTTCLLDPAAGLLTLKTQRGTICQGGNDNSNILVVPIPDCDFDAVLSVKRFEPTRRTNHVSLATLDDQDNVYRVSYWLNYTDGKREFVCTKEENARHSFVRNTEGMQDSFVDMEDHPFRLRIVRKGNTISTYWGKESGPWFLSGKTLCRFKPRFIGFFATQPNLKQRNNTDEQIDCVIDSFELKLSPAELKNK